MIATHLRSIEIADSNSMCFYIYDDKTKLNHLNNCILVCNYGIYPIDKSVTCVETEDPKVAFYILAQELAEEKNEHGIHPTAIISEKAKIHPSVSIGPYCVIGESDIGPKTTIGSHVKIFDKTNIGKGVTIDSGAMIGPAGHIWAWDKLGRKRNLPSVGGTVIEDGCCISTNVSIVRGALADTVLKRGVCIAHGTTIGHDCYIGKETFMSSGVRITGSVTIGKDCFMGSGCVLTPGVKLGDSIIVGAGSVVTKNFLEELMIIRGVPAQAIRKLQEKEKLAGIPLR